MVVAYAVKFSMIQDVWRSFKETQWMNMGFLWRLLERKVAGLEMRILEPGAISLKIARKLLLVHLFVHKFIWEPGAFHHPEGANLFFCSLLFQDLEGGNNIDRPI